jgi:NADH-quinone oxidoreductase subunit J
MPILEILLVLIIIAFAILSVRVKNIIYALLFFALMSVNIAAFYFVLNAPYVAVFQLMIYAGAVVVLFLAAVMLTVRKTNEGEKVES